jgi:hypothetical protein
VLPTRQYSSRPTRSIGWLASGDCPPQRNHTDSWGGAETRPGKESPHQISRPRAGTVHVRQKTDARIAVGIWQRRASLPPATTRERKQGNSNLAPEAQCSSRICEQAGWPRSEEGVELRRQRIYKNKDRSGLHGTTSSQLQDNVVPPGSYQTMALGLPQRAPPHLMIVMFMAEQTEGGIL